MKTVLVLLDDELRRSNFLDGDKNSSRFGISEPILWMCRIQTEDELRIFRYEVFGLLTKDAKLDQLISRKDGLVIILRKCDSDISSRIKDIVTANQNKPIMLILEDIKLEHLPSWFASENRKSFGVGEYSAAKKWFYQQIQNTKVVKLENQYTSRTIPIEEMAAKFEDKSLEMELWDHFGRLRIVHYYLSKNGFKQTIDQNGELCKHWKAYKTSVGHGRLWNYTLTRFWTNIIYQMMELHKGKSFEQMYDATPSVQNGSLHKKYYYDETIFSDTARNNWVAPDRPE